MTAKGNLPSCATVTISRHEPLHRRAPTRDAAGKPVSDFMMLIPRLRERPRAELMDVFAGIQAVLGGHPEVLFADLNLKLNLLWVSLTPRLGLIEQLAVELRARVPEAKLITGDYQNCR
ncbi:MAG: hypothetical protein U9Q71_06180 [Pseudomonadota bacterium]|nr:hypothetical protein [Pseudomonadota bacterium]